MLLSRGRALIGPSRASPPSASLRGRRPAAVSLSASGTASRRGLLCAGTGTGGRHSPSLLRAPRVSGTARAAAQPLLRRPFCAPPASAEPPPRPGLLGLPARRPLLFGAVISCFKTCLADGLVQKYLEERDEIDWRRNLIFGGFGFFYLGCFQYFVYVQLFARRLFPSAAGALVFKPCSFRCITMLIGLLYLT